jgi:hypothetical protein
MNVEIGAEAVLFPEKEYICGIFVAVWVFARSILSRIEKKDLWFISYCANIH